MAVGVEIIDGHRIGVVSPLAGGLVDGLGAADAAAVDPALRAGAFATWPTVGGRAGVDALQEVVRGAEGVCVVEAVLLDPELFE